MRIASRDRIWLLGGLVIAILVTFFAWEFVIKGQQDETASVRENIASTDTQVTTLTHQVNVLRADSVNLPKYKAQLLADQQALPTDAGLPAFLRELHAAADASHMAVAQLQIGQVQPVVGTTSTTPIYSIAVTMLASGPLDAATAFLNQLQVVQPRAVLLSSVSETPGSGNLVQLNLTFSAFVQPVDGVAPSTS